MKEAGEYGLSLTKKGRRQVSGILFGKQHRARASVIGTWYYGTFGCFEEVTWCHYQRTFNDSHLASWQPFEPQVRQNGVLAKLLG